jgi:hypothetical protein
MVKSIQPRLKDIEQGQKILNLVKKNEQADGLGITVHFKGQIFQKVSIIM